MLIQSHPRLHKCATKKLLKVGKMVMLDKKREYALQQIVKECGLPVFVKKSGWSNDFCFRAERTENGIVYGTAFKNGAVHRRKFGGDYSYHLNELFLLVKSKPEEIAEKNSKNENDDNLQSHEINEQELLASKLESATELAKINVSKIIRVAGSIEDKEFSHKTPSLKSKSDVFEEEKKHTKSIIHKIRHTIEMFLKEIRKPQQPEWYERETGYGGTIVSQATQDYKTAVYENIKIENETNELKEAADHPYFYHVRLKFDDEPAPTDVFIGEKMVYDREQGNTTVVSWQSELGSLAYEKERKDIRVEDGAHAVVHFRREVLIKDGELKEAVETYNSEGTIGEEEEVMVYDAFLLKVLEAKREERQLTNIIPSIQRNQYQIIKAPINENLIVQGCAGCGKTMILLHRISQLLYNHKSYHEQDFLILSPSPQFNQHIRPLLRNLRLNRIGVKALPEYYVDCLKSYNNMWGELVDDSRLYSDAETDLKYAEYFYSKEYMDLLAQRVPKKIEAIKENEKAINELAEKKRVLQDSNIDVATINSEIERLKRMRRISIFDDEFSDILPAGMKPGKRKRPNCKAELYAMVLLYYLCYGSRAGFPVVCIDEGQDLACSEYELIRSLNKNAIFNVYGDLAQRINSHGIATWEELNSIGSFSRYRINENYRNTNQITNFINDELMMNMTGLGLNGIEVDLCTESQLVYERIIAPKDRKVVIYKEKEALDRFAIELNDYDVYNVSEVKGMEYETVFVIPNGMTDNEMYVSYSRALNKLFLLDI